MPQRRKIRRALISVYDKTWVVEFARALHNEFGIEIISTGGTAKALTEAGIPVTLVEDITGFPEMLDGRVKTLHPKIFAAILADRDNPEHMRQLKEQGIGPIDMVVVNLYPFAETVADPNCKCEDAVEMIDIGGPCLLRAAAKNHKQVLVLHDPFDWQSVLTWLREDTLSDEGWKVVRRDYAVSAFRLVSSYNAAITDFLVRHDADAPGSFHALLLSGWDQPRYGENPHQRAEVLRPGPPWKTSVPRLFSVDPTASNVSVELSFNNYVDASAALELCAELTRAADRLAKTDQRSVPQGLGGRPPAGQVPKKRGGPTSGRLVSDEQFTRRHLPHIERPEATYFITFRVRRGKLSPDERDLALSACTFWHGKKMTLHCACVMPDHVHLLLTPLEEKTGRWLPLGELLRSIKNYSALQINRTRGVQGSLWLDENFDRLIRDERDFCEKWDYIYHNPVTAGLTTRPAEYRWFWQSALGCGELVDTDADDRPEAGPPLSQQNRSRAGPPNVTTTPPRACCFIKHTNACGAAVGDDPVETYRRAYLGDPNAAMGGILAVNFAVDAAFAEAVMETYQRFGKPLKEAGHPNPPQAFFIEVWVAPEFDEAAIELIRTKKKWGERVRLLAVGDMSMPPHLDELEYKTIASGMLAQTRDLVGLDEDQWKVVTERQPTEQELVDMRLAWLVCKHTKSNAISICAGGMLIGNGAGQMSRVMSCRIATWLAKDNGHEEKLRGAAAASDGFFPFRDGPDVLADAGVTAIIQPGGSKRDQAVVDACNERGLAMIHTGTRHFRH